MSRWIPAMALFLLFAAGTVIGATFSPQPLSASQECEEDVCDPAPWLLQWIMSDSCMYEPGIAARCDMVSEKRCVTRSCSGGGGGGAATKTTSSS